MDRYRRGFGTCGAAGRQLSSREFLLAVGVAARDQLETHSENNIGNSSLRMLPNEYRGKTVRICNGKGRGQERTILANTKRSLTMATKWTVEPDASSVVSL